MTDIPNTTLKVLAQILDMMRNTPESVTEINVYLPDGRSFHVTPHGVMLSGSFTPEENEAVMHYLATNAKHTPPKNPDDAITP